MDKLFNSAHLINIIAKWKYHIITIVVISIILGVFFSSPIFITPLYKSNAIVYPANIEPYSNESETEQMLQIFNSQDITNSVINEFDLAKHYEIEKDYKYFQTALYNTYHEHINISKTQYESVEIVVTDKSPDTAALIANAIIGYYDKKISSMHKSKSIEVIDMYNLQLQKKRQVLDSLKNILYKLGTEQGLFEYSAQSQEIMRGLLGTINGSSNTKINKKEVNKLLKSMEKGSGQLIEVVQMIQDEARSYVDVKLDYEMAVRFTDSNLTYSNIISLPYPSDKKSYPIRWIIVALFAVASFVMSLLIIFLIESNNQKS